MEDYIIETLETVNLENIEESLKFLLQELVKIRVYNEWIIGLSVAIFSLLIVIIFSIFISKYK